MVVSALVPCVARAQAAPPLPLKMGLWQGTTVMKMSGLTLPPEIVERMRAAGRPVPGAEPKTMEMQSCLTPEKWKQIFTRAQNNENCKITNLKQDSSGMSADVVCDSGRVGTGKGHLQMDFVSTEKVHGTMHMEIVSQQQQPIVMDVTIDNTYQGADCKGVSPDTPKMIMK